MQTSQARQLAAVNVREASQPLGLTADAAAQGWAVLPESHEGSGVQSTKTSHLQRFVKTFLALLSIEQRATVQGRAVDSSETQGQRGLPEPGGERRSFEIAMGFLSLLPPQPLPPCMEARAWIGSGHKRCSSEAWTAQLPAPTRPGALPHLHSFVLPGQSAGLAPTIKGSPC